MSSAEIKVTDKRIFTPEGRLREEYSHLEVSRGGAPFAEAEPAPERQPAPTASAAIPSPPIDGPQPRAATGAPLEVPSSSLELDPPTFLDLVSLMAEHCALYLGDLGAAQGESAENLDLARLHIDLLDVLRHKTAGNLEAREAAMLDDVLYQLRVRFVQKRGS